MIDVVTFLFEQPYYPQDFFDKEIRIITKQYVKLRGIIIYY